MRFQRMYTKKSNKANGVKRDQIGKLTGYYVSKEYPEKPQRLKCLDKESNRTFVILSNNI